MLSFLLAGWTLTACSTLAAGVEGPGVGNAGKSTAAGIWTRKMDVRVKRQERNTGNAVHHHLILKTMHSAREGTLPTAHQGHLNLPGFVQTPLEYTSTVVTS